MTAESRHPPPKCIVKIQKRGVGKLEYTLQRAKGSLEAGLQRDTAKPKGKPPVRLLLILASLVLVAPCFAKERPSDGTTATGNDISIPIDARSLTQLPSQWADYFGTHYTGSPDGVGRWWNTVRSYGGTHTGVYATDRSETHIGPFTGKEVRVGLADFHSRFNRNGKTAEQLIPDLIQHRFTAIYQMTSIVRPSLDPFDKDLAYWTVYQIHKEFPDAWRYLAWQIGNEVVSGHFDPKGQKKDTGIPEEAPQGQFHGYDLDWKEDYYVEDYLAPAIEAIERASNDVYGNPRKIKTLLGSMNPYNRQNIRFLENVMNRTFAGKNAPTLAGDPVWQHIDVLTVHYMFGGKGTVDRMQGYVDDYLRTGKISGIWATEEHGLAGKGPVTVVERGFRFFAWVARNGLSADQARLVWWGDGARKPGGSARDAEQLLGDFLSERPLFFRKQDLAGGQLYVVSHGTASDLTRLLVAAVPNRGETLALDRLRLLLSEQASGSRWQCKTVQYSADTAPENSTATAESRNSELQVRVDAKIQEPFLLLLQSMD